MLSVISVRIDSYVILLSMQIIQETLIDFFYHIVRKNMKMTVFCYLLVCISPPQEHFYLLTWEVFYKCDR